MDLHPLGQVLYGFISGLTELLPVSAGAHSIVYLKLLGSSEVRGFPNLLIHIAILAALYTYIRVQLTKMYRARKLAQIPKKKRKRPLDVENLMNSSFLTMAAMPIVVMLLFFNRLSVIEYSLPVVAGFLFLNAIILYVPQFLPRSNRNASTVSRFDGILLGLGITLSVVPGFSGIGAALSIASVRGLDRSYSLNMTLMASMVYFFGMIIFDAVAIVTYGFGQLSVQIVGIYLLAAAAAFIGTRLAIRVMRALTDEIGYHIFSYYCFGCALFVFILNLMA